MIKFCKIISEGRKTEKLLILLSIALLFIISIIYFYWYGEGIFLYQENKSLFIFSNEYLRKYITKPGGLLEYAGNFITQFYYYPFYGSLINTIFLILFFALLIRINRKLFPASFSILILTLPVILLFFVQIRYTHSINNSLGYLLIASCFLVTISFKRNVNRYITTALYPLFYYIAGSFALIYLVLFIVYCIIYEDKIHKYLLPLYIISISVITFFVYKEIIFLQTGKQLLFYPLPVFDVSRIPVAYSILSISIIVFPLLIKINGFLKLNHKSAALINIAILIILFPVTVLFLVKNYDHNLKILFRIEKSVFRQDWNAIIKIQEKFHSSNSNCQYYYNLALSEKGELCSRMFHAPQNFGINSLMLPREIENLNRAYYFYYAIALIGEAHHLAYESMVLYGYRPENIKLLIKTNLINGNHMIAERYIKVFKRTLYYRKWAEKFENMLYNPELIKTDSELGEKIRLLPREDFFVRPDDIQNIDLVLWANPDNKKAFEYKLARLLLQKDLRAIVNEVKKMKEMGYASLPRHVEEAMLVFRYSIREFPDLGGLYINPDTELRFNNYLTVYNLNITNKSRLESEVKRVGGNTFWYYYQFK